MIKGNRLLAPLFVAVMGAGCTPFFVVPEHADSDPQVRQCRAFLNQLERMVQRQGVRDAQAVKISGFPYLRVNRFLSSFRNRALDGSQFNAWLDRLQSLAQEAQQLEVSNLPQAALPNLTAIMPPAQRTGTDTIAIANYYGACATLLRNTDLIDPGKKRLLLKRATVPPAYKSWRRVLGFYALATLPAAYGIRHWQNRTRNQFAVPLQELPIHGTLVDYAPPVPERALSRPEVAAILHNSMNNPLSIPEPDAKELELLFTAFAPIWRIDTASDADRIGYPLWETGAKIPAVDTSQPTVYRQVSHTRVGDTILLQLNYVIWFPSRPRTSGMDLLGGHLDGITWRVTVWRDGTPLLFDSIHNCGCYHLFFPGAGVKPKPLPDSLAENAFIPQQAPDLSTNSSVVLRIASNTHYIERLNTTHNLPENAVRYRWAEYTQLRSLPRPPKGRRSLFAENGLVPGSQRRERFVLWPLGILSPGAMRQWGHHATAFVGRRHFDDPHLLTKNFHIERPIER